MPLPQGPKPWNGAWAFDGVVGGIRGVTEGGLDNEAQGRGVGPGPGPLGQGPELWSGDWAFDGGWVVVQACLGGV